MEPSAYLSTTPCSCVVLKKRWDEWRYRFHRNKVDTARSTLDNKPPKVYPHLYERMKKYVMEEQRMATIQKDNYLLLTRMAEIMQTKGSIDNYNDYHVKSLNGPLRQRELLRIAQENRAILARIQATRPHYNPRKWEAEWRDKKVYLAFIAKFPHTGVHYKQKLKIIKVSKPPEEVAANKLTPRTAVQQTYNPGTSSGVECK